MLAFDKDPAAARVDWSQCGHGFSKQRFRARSYGQALRAKTLSDNAHKDRRRHQCRQSFWKTCSDADILISETSAFVVLSVLPSTTRPFTCFSSSGKSAAIRSTTFN